MFGLSRLSPVQFLVLLVIGFVLLRGPILELFTDPKYFVAFIVALVVGITVHEASHATVAVLLGDPTPRSMGRVSLNPLRHLDPMGSVAMLIAGFGWGKPVMFNPRYLRGDQRMGSALVAVAGPISNVATALIAALILHNAGWSFSHQDSRIAAQPQYLMLVLVALVNVGLAAFNLIPIPPLDGFGFLDNLLPPDVSAAIAPIAQYGPLILLALIFLGPYLGINFLGTVMGPIVHTIQTMIDATTTLLMGPLQIRIGS
jgi:Zn-dependent protease